MAARGRLAGYAVLGDRRQSHDDGYKNLAETRVATPRPGEGARTMFLGTPRRWWIAAGLLFVAALILIGTDTGGTLGDVVGVLLLFASVGVFGMSPMRYGQGARRSTTTHPDPPVTTEPSSSAEPPAPRPAIEAGDPSDV